MGKDRKDNAECCILEEMLQELNLQGEAALGTEHSQITAAL